MKAIDNIDTLVRNLDLLGIQEEIDLRFIMEEGLWMGFDEDIQIGVKENTYNDCLRHNDKHHVKIVSATIHYSITMIGVDAGFNYETDNLDSLIITPHSYNSIIMNFDSIIMTFSNGVELKFTIHHPIREVNKRQDPNSRQMVYFGSGAEILTFHLEIKDPIDGTTYLLSSLDSNNELEPNQAKEYLRFSQHKSCIHSFFDVLESYFMREGITEGILEELFL